MYRGKPFARALTILAALTVFNGCESPIADPDEEIIAPPPQKPAAALRTNVTTGDAPLQIEFRDESSGEIKTYDWDFGDGESSSEKNPKHAYKNPGAYTVRLTVTGEGGTDTRIMAKLIRVNQILEVKLNNVGPFWPRRINGDCEFAGNGPDVTVSAKFALGYPGETYQRITLTLSMVANETRSDWSTASGSWTVDAYRSPRADLEIKEIMGATTQSWSYRDTDTQYDYSPSYALGSFKIMGDTSDADICDTGLNDTHMYFLNGKVRFRIGPK